MENEIQEIMERVNEWTIGELQSLRSEINIVIQALEEDERRKNN